MKIVDNKFFYGNAQDAKDDKNRYCCELLIDFDKGLVRTNCGDPYYDYSISFDSIVELADCIKSRKKEGEED